jgi:hypothetical protein
MCVESKIGAKVIPRTLLSHNSLNNQELFRWGLLVSLLQGDDILGACSGFRHSAKDPAAVSLEGIHSFNCSFTLSANPFVDIEVRILSQPDRQKASWWEETLPSFSCRSAFTQCCGTNGK